MENQMMQALVWLGPRDMVQRAEPMPKPAEGEVLISVGAVGICGSELGGFLGHNSLRFPPLIMGHECAGQVVQVTGGRFATGNAATVGARVTFNPLVVCDTCDRCLSGKSNLCRRRQLVGAHRPGAFALGRCHAEDHNRPTGRSATGSFRPIEASGNLRWSGLSTPRVGSRDGRPVPPPVRRGRPA